MSAFGIVPAVVKYLCSSFILFSTSFKARAGGESEKNTKQEERIEEVLRSAEPIRWQQRERDLEEYKEGQENGGQEEKTDDENETAACPVQSAFISVTFSVFSHLFDLRGATPLSPLFGYPGQ